MDRRAIAMGVYNPKVMKRSRRITHRKPSYSAKMDTLANMMLSEAQALFRDSANLDTAVRDIVSEGLARIVYAAYDTKACAECVSDFDSIAYIQTKTYEWFRERGFVEWFCAGASTLFRTSPRDFFRMKATQLKKAVRITKEKIA